MHILKKITVAYKLVFMLAFVGCVGYTTDSSVPSFEDNTQKSQSEADFSKIFINGSDAGSYFQTLFMLGNYKQMLQMTAKESMELHGVDVLFDFYKNNLDFSFEIGKLLTVINNKDGTKTLVYQSSIFATNHKIEIVITWEDDMPKIIMPDCLSAFPLVK